MKNVIVSNEPVAQKGEIVQFTRPDQFTVFLDDDEELDNICLNCDPETVIKAVAIRRAQQIARNYARKYAPELLPKFKIKQLKSTPPKNFIQYSDDYIYCTRCGSQVHKTMDKCPNCGYCIVCGI